MRTLQEIRAGKRNAPPLKPRIGDDLFAPCAVGGRASVEHVGKVAGVVSRIDPFSWAVMDGAGNPHSVQALRPGAWGIVEPPRASKERIAA